MHGIVIVILFGIMLWLFKEGWLFLTAFPATAICWSLKQDKDPLSVDRFFIALIYITLLLTLLWALKSLFY